MLAFIRHTHQVEITAQKTVDIIVWIIVMLAFIRHTHQVEITVKKTVDIIVWIIVMLAFIRHTHQVEITAQKNTGHHCMDNCSVSIHQTHTPGSNHCSKKQWTSLYG